MILQLVVDSPPFHFDPPSLRTVDGPSTVRKIDNTTPYQLNQAFYLYFKTLQSVVAIYRAIHLWPVSDQNSASINIAIQATEPKPFLNPSDQSVVGFRKAFCPFQ